VTIARRLEHLPKPTLLAHFERTAC